MNLIKHILKQTKPHPHEKLEIPEVTTRIPLNDFLMWYNKQILEDFSNLSFEEVSNYIDNTSKDVLDKEIIKYKRKEAKGYTPWTPPYLIYYRMKRFSELENNKELLMKEVKSFIFHKSVEKMLESK